MIRLAEDVNDLRALCADSPFGCQILSAAEAYGLERSFAFFWKDSVAAYGKLDGVMRICGTITDAEEAQAFLRAVGAERVVCSVENAEKLGLNITERGVILYKDLEHTAPMNVNREEISPAKVYEVLKSCGMVGEFESFYLDLSHRVRHGTAVCAAIYDEGKMAAAAVAMLVQCGSGESTGMQSISSHFSAASEVTNETYAAHSYQMLAHLTLADNRCPPCGLISAVAVRPEYQRQGLGSKIVCKMEEKLFGRVYLLRAENENECFYAQLGYTPCGAWCTGILG